MTWQKYSHSAQCICVTNFSSLSPFHIYCPQGIPKGFPFGKMAFWKDLKSLDRQNAILRPRLRKLCPFESFSFFTGQAHLAKPPRRVKQECIQASFTIRGNTSRLKREELSGQRLSKVPSPFYAPASQPLGFFSLDTPLRGNTKQPSVDSNVWEWSCNRLTV